MTKHTDAPWEISVHTTDESWLIVANCQGFGRCQLARIPDAEGDEEYQANARLMAAAPELLEALKAVVAISDRKHEAWDKAKAAIAKAEGHNSDVPHD